MLPETVTERVAVVLLKLSERPLTTVEVAEMTGLSLRGAYYLMNRLCRVRPIVLENGQWRIILKTSFTTSAYTDCKD